MKGRIIKNISNTYTVLSDNKLFDCKARGKFKNDDLTPFVGDLVLFDEDKLIIEKIEDRKNELNRPVVSNVDVAVILTSVKRPDFSSFLLDKMLVNVTLKNIKPIICFTKWDLLSPEEQKNMQEIFNYYSKYYDVFINTDINKFKKLVDGKIVVLTGQTGVGKSSLLNKLNPNLCLKTDEISDALNRGKHTTRHVELFDLGYAFIADTPGFSALDIDQGDIENIRYCFPEFKNDECKFRDCKHFNEIDCKIKRDVLEGIILNSRYESYKSMVIK